MAGDRRPAAEFDALYTRAYGSLVAQVYALTGDLAEAQEAVQEAFLRAWQRWPAVSGYDDPLVWVRTVAFRVAVSRFRKSTNALKALRRRGLDPDVPGASVETVALVRALRQLPDAQRRALVLHHMADRSVAQVARDEGVPEGTVKARLSRGRAALAAALTDPTTQEASRG